MGGMGKRRLRRKVRAEGDVPQGKETAVAYGGVGVAGE